MLEGYCPTFLQIGAAAAAGGRAGGEGATTVLPTPPPSSSSSSKFRTERLWKDFFRDPSHWWDRRSSKANHPNSPDFTHKHRRESLWLDAWDNPSWVYQILRGRDFINRQASPQESLPTEEEDLGSSTIKDALLTEKLHIGEDLIMYGNIRVDAPGIINKKNTLKEKLNNAEENLIGSFGLNVLDDILKDTCVQEKLPKVQRKVYGNTRQVRYRYIFKETSQKETPLKAEQVSGKVGMDMYCNKEPSLMEGLLKEERKAFSNINGELKEYDTTRIMGDNDIDWEHLSLEEALLCLDNTSHHPPSIQSIYTVLHKCRKEKKHAYVSQLLAYIQQHGLETHTLLGNQLVLILADAGNMSDSQQVFDGLLHRRKRSWNFLITGYVRYGKPQHALHLYQRMQEESPHQPDPFTFVSLMRSCAELKDEETGSKVHNHIMRTGLLEIHGVLGNALVNMYIKFKLLAKAQEVFDKLPLTDVISWNTLIAGYAKHGHGQEALNCFDQMQKAGVSPNSVTYICSMKACASIGDMNKGLELHAEIARRRLLEMDLHVGSALVDMYAKGGSLVKAQEVFDMLPRKDIVLWNALIAGYVQSECYEEALKCFRLLQHESLSPNAATFISCLKACGSIGAVEEGREIHNQVDRNGLLEKDFIVGCAVVNMYAKCGLLAEAQEVFDNLSTRDVISWTALITGYAEHGYSEEALACFEQMQVEGICPNAITFISSLKACGVIGAIHEGQGMHAEVARKGWLKSDSLLGSTLVDMYSKCGLLLGAQEVFDEIPIRNVVSWNALITGYVQYGYGKDAIMCFERMQVEGILPDVVTYVCSLKACGSIRDPVKGRRLHSQFMKEGLMGGYLAAGNGLVDMYTKCGLLVEAQEVFDELPVRDIVSWNALLAGYAQNEIGEKALDCFEQMQLESFSPDVITYVSSLKACGGIGALTKGEEIHTEIVKDEMLKRDSVIGNALIDMYSRCGSLHKAQEVFDSLVVRDTVAWTTLIVGYAQLGESSIVFDIFKRMVEDGVWPNLVTFVGVLNACSHAGLVEKGQLYFEAMCEIYNIVPISEHHTCMVDLLCRAGQLDLAVSIIKRMHLLPDLVVWHTLLGACRKWNNVKLGREAFEHAMQLDNRNTSTYTTLYNIYASAGREEVAMKMRALRIERSNTEAQESCWWTDSHGVVRSFFDSGKKHFRTADMLDKILHMKVKEEGSHTVLQEGSLLVVPENFCDIDEDLCVHSVKCVVARALFETPDGTSIHIVKNTRVCYNCHAALTLTSKLENRRILCKDVLNFHIFKEGRCTCENNLQLGHPWMNFR